jgi:hypothetical protein
LFVPLLLDSVHDVDVIDIGGMYVFASWESMVVYPALMPLVGLGGYLVTGMKNESLEIRES